MKWQERIGPVIAVAALCLASPASAQFLAATASQAPAIVRPGQANVAYFTLTISNSNLVQYQLTALTLTNGTSGIGIPSQRDAELGTVRLIRDAGTAAYEPGVDTVVVAQAVASGGKVRYTPISVNVPALGSVRLHAVSNVPLNVRDGDRIDLSVAAAGDMTFTLGGSTNSTFPLSPAGDFPIDGMIAAQITLAPVPPDSIIAGTLDELALDVILPSNGYASDSLNALAVVNEGTAVVGSDLTGVSAWAESNGTNTFDSDLLLGSLVFTGGQWQISGLNYPVPTSGLHIYFTVNTADLASQGRTIRLALPFSPSPGVNMQSGNDGPIDAVVRNPTSRPISAANRVTWSSVSLPPLTVRPGDRDVPLLAVDALNSYASAQVMTAFTVTNVSAGGGTQTDRDHEVQLLALRADGNGNGVLDGPGTDPVLGTAIFQDGRGAFVSLSHSIPAGLPRRFFVTADISLTGARDSDSISVMLTNPTDVAFSGSTRVVGVWPLYSGARAAVDGMVAAQIVNVGAPVATAGANDGPVLAMDVIVPRNGYAPDTLVTLSVVNLGDADGGDIAALTLWKDGGDGVFSQGAGDDALLGALTPQGGQWRTGTLANPIPSAGSRLFVGLTVTGAPRDSATVRLAIPIGGIQNRSSNDGPLNAAIANPSEITISNAALLATVRIETPASTLGQLIQVSMVIRNTSGENVTGIAPSALAASGPGALTYVSGPNPPTFNLAPAAADTFRWTYTAAGSGDVALSGLAQGTGSPSGLLARSLLASSNAHHVYQSVTEIPFSATSSMPGTVSRGQAGVIPLHLTFTNTAGAQAATVRVTDLRIRLEDGAGNGIVPSDLLSAVTVGEGSTVLLHKTALEASGAEVALALATPALVAGGASVTLTLALDIAPGATAPSVRAVIADSTWIAARDANGGVPVVARLQSGGSYPIRSAVARVVSEATRLDVAAISLPVSRVGRGQAAIPLLALRVENPGLAGITSDARISSFDVALTDTNGVAVARAADHLSRIQVRTAFQVLADRAVFSTDGGVLTLVLNPPLAIPVNAPVDLTLLGDVAGSAVIGAFRTQLGDSAAFDVRDAGTGAVIPAVYAVSPLTGPALHVERVAETVAVRGTPMLPSQLTVGRTDVVALTAVLRHPGTPGTARVRADSLVIQCRNESRQPLVPSSYLSRLRVLWNGVEVGNRPDPPTTATGVGISLAGSLLEPGDSAVVSLVIDVSPTAPAGFLELMVFDTGIRAADANLGSSVSAEPDQGGELPMTSGLTRLVPPARDLVVDLRDGMPAALAADGTAVPVGSLTFTNAAPSNSDSIFVDHLRVRAGDRAFATIAIGAAAERVQAFVGGTLWAESGPLSADSTTATLLGVSRLGVAAGQVVEVELRVAPRAAGTTAFRVGCDDTDIGIVQPSGAVLQVAAQPAPGRTFPLWTEVGSIARLTLRDSYSNFPNPFAAGRAATTFAYYLRDAGRVTLRVFTSTGEAVATLLDKAARGRGMAQGDLWDGRNGVGRVVRNGVYVAELSVEYADGSSERVLRRVAVVR
jgi:hypothetical protein